MERYRIASLLVALVLPAAAQEPRARSAYPYIQTTGEATVSAKPDRAKLTVGVITQAASAQAAGSENAAKTDSMVAALHRALEKDAEIHTSGYSLSPNFRYPKDGGQPVLTGYTATNGVEIVTGDLANLGKLIDAATKAGANNVNGLEFLLKDEAPVRAQALAEAARKARANAEAIAAALGLKVVRVLAAEQGSPPQIVRPMFAMAARTNNAETPIAAGNIQVQATVTLTVQVGP